MSRACGFLMRGVCFPNLVAERALLQQSGHPGHQWKGVVMSCWVFLVIVYGSSTEPEEILGKGREE